MAESWTPGYVGFTRAQRATILQRDPVCMVCLAAPSAHADHILSVAECVRAGVEPNTTENGQGICVPCHDAKTQREAQVGQQLRRARLLRRPRKHPGLIEQKGRGKGGG